MSDKDVLVRRQNGPGTVSLPDDRHQMRDILVGEWVSAVEPIERLGLFGKEVALPAGAAPKGVPFSFRGAMVQAYSSPKSAEFRRETDGDQKIHRPAPRKTGKYDKTSTKKKRRALQEDDGPVAVALIGDADPAPYRKACPRTMFKDCWSGGVDIPASVRWVFVPSRVPERGELVAAVDRLDRAGVSAVEAECGTVVCREAFKAVEGNPLLEDVFKAIDGPKLTAKGKRVGVRGRRKYRRDVAVVVTVHNALRATKQALKSLQCDPGRDIKPKIIVVDDASVPFVADWLKAECKAQRWTYMRNESRGGYIEAVNAGIEKAYAEGAGWVCALNSDTMVTPGWLGRMVAAGESDDSIGLVGPYSNNAVHLSGPRWMMEGEDPNTLAEKLAFVSKCGYPDALTPTGFCLLIRKAAWDDHGPFKHIAGEAYGEETAFCIEMVEAGGRAVLADNALVWHQGHATYGTEKGNIAEGEAVRKVRQVYKAQLAAQSEAFTATRKDLVDYAWARMPWWSPSVRPRVVFWCHNWGIYGGVFAIANVVNRLILMGWDARVACIRVDPAALAALPMLTHPMQFKSAAEFMNEFGTRVDSGVVVATVWNTAEEVKRACEKHDGLKAAYFIQDYESTFCDPRGELLTAPANVFASYQMIEPKIVNSRWVLDKIETDNEASGCTYIPVGVDGALFHPRMPRGESKMVLFFSRPETPYRGPEAVRAVCKALHEHDADLRLVTYGGTDRQLPHYVEQQGVIPQERVAELYAKATVFFEASHTQGFGLQGLEAMASGCALVSTRNKGIDNYGTDGENCVLVDVGDADAATSEIVGLLKNDSRRQALVEAGHITARGFDWDDIAKLHAEFYKEVLG